MSESQFDPAHVTSTLQRLAKQIKRERKKTISEAKTVLKYVIPLLESLGWSVEDDRLVPQWEVRGRRVDIALLARDKPDVFVEAKALREDLSLKDKEADQALDYGYKSGTKWCVLTNGERYEIYDAFARVDHPRKLVASFSVLQAAEAPEAELPRVRLLSFEAVRTGELEDVARRNFAHDRVRELLADPTPAVVSALHAELKDCGMSADDVTLGLSQALGVEPQAPEEKAAEEPWQHFKWMLQMEEDGSFVLDVRYLLDESKSFTVRGKRVPPDQDFRPARTKLLEEIYDNIRPLYPDLEKTRVRAKAWSGVHRVYPARLYAKKK